MKAEELAKRFEKIGIPKDRIIVFFHQYRDTVLEKLKYSELEKDFPSLGKQTSTEWQTNKIGRGKRYAYLVLRYSLNKKSLNPNLKRDKVKFRDYMKDYMAEYRRKEKERLNG